MYYDLELLKKANLPIDELIPRDPLDYYCKPAPMHPMFNAVTLELVKAFEGKANSHIMAILQDYASDTPKYSYFYYLVDQRHKLYNMVYFDYKTFPLIINKEAVLKEIRRIARKYTTNVPAQVDATCLYLLYFYALLVNIDSNWITMDYISRGNKYHQHLTRLNRRMETTRKWV